MSMRAKANNKEIENMTLETAAGFIARRGLKGWSMTDLARACGLAKNTLYKIVGSKEELVEQIALDQIEYLDNNYLRIIQNTDGYQSAARMMFAEGPKYIAKRPRILLPDVFVEYPAIKQKILEKQQQAASRVIEYMKVGQKEGHIRSDVDPEFLYNLLQGIIDHYVRSGFEGDDLTEALTKAFRCLREGVRLGDW